MQLSLIAVKHLKYICILKSTQFCIEIRCNNYISYFLFQVLTCEPLSLKDGFVFVACRDGYKYGASCSFSCFMSYKLVGDLKVTCERNSSNENIAYWNWTNNTESYCEKYGK